MALSRNYAVELFWRWHPRLYRFSGGLIGGNLAGLPVLLLETIGRKSGQRRETALTYLPYAAKETDAGESPGAFVVIASVLGESAHPAWYHNLVADPKVSITVGRDQIAVVARDAEGEERERIWDDLVQRSPDYAEYRTRTDRRIPVVVLERRGS
jgi:deazaflavin-dependent oxidoreductase (nitroreductase family)